MTLKKKEYFVVKISLTIGYYFFQSLLIFHGIAISTYKAANCDIIPIIIVITEHEQNMTFLSVWVQCYL